MLQKKRIQSTIWWAIGMVMAIALLGLSTVSAHAAPAFQEAGDDIEITGPNNALIPTGERATLGPDEMHWYTFKYVEGADEDNPSEAIAELTMARPDSVSFEVWTEDDVHRWQNGEEFDATGAGTPAYDEDAENDRDRSRLTWVGSGAAKTTWYIVVENETLTDASYRLTVSGPEVYFPETDSVMAEAAPSSDEVAPADDEAADVQAMAEAVETEDIGPASALTPTGARRTLAPGETRWFTFQYTAGADDDDPSEAVAELAIAKPDSINLEVWTEEDVRMWANGEEFDPTGVGSPAYALEDEDSDNRNLRLLRWVGSGAAKTTWYLIVENETDVSVPYRLTVTGPDVVF